MKEMQYKYLEKAEVLFKGSYKGYKFAIMNLGKHPCAYVENKNGFNDYEEANCNFYINIPHGLFTYLGSAYWDDDPSDYLGWDYGHYEDFIFGGGGAYDCQGKQWTTEEIYTEVKTVIDSLSKYIKED